MFCLGDQAISEETVIHDSLQVEHELAALLNLSVTEVATSLLPIASLRFIRKEFTQRGTIIRLDQCHFKQVKHPIFYLEIIPSQKGGTSLTLEECIEQERDFFKAMNGNYCVAPRKLELILYLTKQLYFLPKALEDVVTMK